MNENNSITLVGILFLLFIPNILPLDPSQLLIFIVLIALSAFFSGTEIAFLSISKHTVQGLIRDKKFGAKSLEIVKSDMDKLLITVMIGNNLVNVGASALGTIASLSLAKSLSLPEEYGIFIATGVVTLILLLFGDITPKTIFARYSIPIALFVAPIYRILIPLFTPLSFFLNLFVKFVARLLGGNQDYSTKITTSEVEAFIDMSHEGGAVEEDEKKQIKNLLGLSEMTAESVMTPRVNVEFVDIDMSINAVCEMMMGASHSRFPVSGETTDDVEFVITFREAFKLQREGHGERKIKDLSLDKIMKVPLTQPLDDLFEKFQKSRRHIALVLDEHGGTAGIVTMEDVLEEVFGDIKDETDKEDIYIRKKSDTTLEAIGTVLIDDILQEFDIHPTDIGLPEEYNGEPLSYIILSEEEEFPRIETVVVFQSEEHELRLKVIDIEDNVIEKVECIYM